MRLAAPMKVLVLNCGSSSVKFQLIDPSRKRPLAEGLVERVGSRHALLTYRSHGRGQIKEVLEVQNHEAAIRLALSTLLHPEHGAIADRSEINAVGHRVVELDHDRGRAVLEPVHLVELPERAVLVEGLHADRLGEVEQLALAAGARRPHAPHVVVEPEEGIEG